MKYIECGLIDTNNLDSTWIKRFPHGNRSYPVKVWRMLSGQTHKLSINNVLETEGDMPDNSETEQQECTWFLKWLSKCPNANRSDRPTNVIKVGYIIKDFNSDGEQPDIKLKVSECTNWDQSEVELNVPFLSLTKNDMLWITRLPNEQGWLEGYRVNDEKMDIGIVHEHFINKIV